ncbi:MAG: hypothetical protein EXR98_07185 [Gemmataceae bacterium]|nr:hypothetical protein [Gemmataceae bacterium]
MPKSPKEIKLTNRIKRLETLLAKVGPTPAEWTVAAETKPAKTFLQYVAERLMGPPAKPGGSYGESYWICVFHNDTNPSFHTMPHKPEFKDRWLCFGCGMRGDGPDLMKELMPGEDWSRRRARLLQWRQDYEREVKTA